MGSETEMTQTRRQSITESLREGPITALDLARLLGVKVKTILGDLEHVRRSAKGKERFTIRPAECSSCGFVFRNREKLNTPSRCPRCARENIRDPLFSISE